MRAKRTRASSDVSGASPQQPVKKLVKATSVTSETTKAKAKPSSSGNYPEDNDVESDPAKDVMTFQKTCQSIQTLFERIKSLKDQGIDPSVSSQYFKYWIMLQCSGSGRLVSLSAIPYFSVGLDLGNKIASDSF